jgi:hypothetical protein
LVRLEVSGDVLILEISGIVTQESMAWATQQVLARFDDGLNVQAMLVDLRNATLVMTHDGMLCAADYSARLLIEEGVVLPAAIVMPEGTDSGAELYCDEMARLGLWRIEFSAAEYEQALAWAAKRGRLHRYATPVVVPQVRPLVRVSHAELAQ